MTITWFTENYPPNKGGMSRSCDRIISNLRQHHTVNIYHFTNKNKPFSTEHQEQGTYTSVPIYEDSSHTLNMLWSYLDANDEIKKSDCLVAFGSHLCIKGITLMGNWLQRPVLICFRGNDFDTAIFSKKKQDLLHSIQQASAVASVTKEKAKRIDLMNLGTPVFFTPNSIHFEDWQVLKPDSLLAESFKLKFSIRDEQKVIGLIGFLKQKKGIDYFINTLQKSQIIKTVHLHIVGEIEPHIEAELIRYKISYSKIVPESKSELIANYLICDAVAIPSIYDGMPNVIFEAAALEIPIIASKAGGIPDVLDLNTAFLFDVLSEKSLLQALADFNNSNTETLTLIAKKLKQQLKKDFSTTQETQKYLDIFNLIKLESHENQ
jgi:glycosyltransferase involved in cell wall biosynthesis